MSRGSYPLLLTMALSAPGASQALGLGEIHVDSNLNQPLSAHIDIFGASDQELNSLQAAIASRDDFQRFGADRPAFLASTRLQIERDGQQRPVLRLQSTESFTEPLVDLVIQLRWPGGTLLRQFSLLLDPPAPLTARASAPASVPAPAPVAAPAAVLPPTPIPVAAPTTVSPPTPAPSQAAEPSQPAASPVIDAATAPSEESSGETSKVPSEISSEVPSEALSGFTSGATSSVPASYHVQPKDSLQAIARQLGARSAAQVRRMVVGLFRANPAAFEGNINRLRVDVMLRVPEAAELAAPSQYEVNREYRAQMSAWRLAGRPPLAVERPASPASPVESPEPERVAVEPRTAAAPGAEAVTAMATPAAAQGNDETSELTQRVQGLEQSLREMRERIERDNARIRDLNRQLAEGRGAAPVAVPLPAEARAHHAAAPSTLRFLPAAGFGGALMGALWLMWARRGERRRPAPKAAPAAADSPSPTVETTDGHAPAPPVPVNAAPAAQGPAPAAVPAMASAPAMPAGKPPAPLDHAAEVVADLDEEDTLELKPTGDTTTNLTLDATLALHRDENVVDLERTAQHVTVSGDLHAPTQEMHFVERRKSVIDVLRAAIDREPHRRELKMKLLELYYATAFANQASFLEVAKLLARDRDVLTAGDWDRIIEMGKTIAPKDKLFLIDPDAGAELSDVKESAA
ncbi:MAG: FimV/HubP family polar landmark protein [Steroidobacteraceae bacterium]